MLVLWETAMGTVCCPKGATQISRLKEDFLRVPRKENIKRFLYSILRGPILKMVGDESPPLIIVQSLNLRCLNV
jgi:hypothetical protein